MRDAKGRFQTGFSGNPKGRPRRYTPPKADGYPHKLISELRCTIANLEDAIIRYRDDLNRYKSLSFAGGLDRKALFNIMTASDEGSGWLGK